MNATSPSRAWLAVSLAAVLAPLSQAQTANPPGSYAQTCSNIQVSNNTLSATCTTLSGSTQQTRLTPLDSCLYRVMNAGDIANIDGSLICMVDLPVQGKLKFPQAETTLNDWIYSGNNQALYEHGWNIWSGITQPVGEVNGQRVLAFQTWASPSALLYETGKVNKTGLQSAPGTDAHTPGTLQFVELERFKKLEQHTLKAQAASNVGDTGIKVSVAYNPPAAAHAISNKLLYKSTLEGYLKNGYTEVPNFPNNAVTIKPVYKIVPVKSQPNLKLYTMPGWPGTPATLKAFPESDWNACVYVATAGNGSEAGGNSIDVGCKGATAQSTFYLHNFIHKVLSADEARAAGKSRQGVAYQAGDVAILVAMHVTTRETRRWTWQTFWWSANPDTPFAPSSAEIAKMRAKVPLGVQASHYAMSVAYQMVTPAQPITGGKNVGQPLYAYNPHLEAGFDPSTFQITDPANIDVANLYLKNPDDTPKPATPAGYGVQTNCMGCHNTAMYAPDADYYRKTASGGKNPNLERPYTTSFYLSIDDKVFDGRLRLDFAWSLLGFMDASK